MFYPRLLEPVREASSRSGCTRPRAPLTTARTAVTRKGKIIAYGQWGRSRVSTPFHPPYDEMRKVMREVTAGLLELCVSVAKQTRRGKPA